MPANVSTMFYNARNGVPWHKSGTPVDGLLTAAEALDKSGLDWSVVKVPQFHEWEGAQRQSEGSYAIVREADGRQLSKVGVGERYEPIQNADALDFLDSLVETQEAKYETAGALDGGRKIWLLAKTPVTIESVSGDPIENYLCAFNSHDGSKSMGVLFTAVRVVCENTLTAAIRGAERCYKIRHTTNWQAKVEQAREVLGFAIRYQELFAEEMKTLAERAVNFDITKVFVEKLLPISDSIKQKGSIERIKEQRNELFRLIEEGRGTEIAGVRGTAYGLYNAAAEYADYRMKTKGAKLGPEEQMARRTDSILFGGPIAKFKDSAFSLAQSIVNGNLVAA